MEETLQLPPLVFNQGAIDKETIVSLYTELVKPRMIEEKMLVLLRQGRISKWFSGIGQEAISVGTALAMDSNEYILPMHRNLGIFTARKMPFGKLFKQWQGKKGGFSKGRERSFHFGANEYRIVGMISHLGPQLGIADGIALGNLLKKNNQITAVFTGDGGTSQGDFHESVNVAAVWDLPVIFIIENNGYGLSTPSSEQFRCAQFIDKCIGYGIEGVKVDGNNVLAVYQAVKDIAAKIKERPRPFLLECVTFRMRGHEEASGTKYIPKELFEIWATKDPVENYEKWLLAEGLITPNQVEEIKKNIKAEIEAGLEEGFAEPAIEPNTDEELADVYVPYNSETTIPANTKQSDKRLVDAISDGLKQSLEKHPNLIVMGQDIAEYGGVFKVTEGFVDTFGKDRIRNTPLCESAIVGTALGLSIKGYKAVMEMQFADFVTCGFNQIINNLAKINYRWGQNADVVVRMPTGAGVNAGPFHSQSNEAWFFHTPGLKVVYPAFAHDAKGLLCAAINDPNPVMFFEHKALYRSIESPVYDDYYTVEIGKANLLRQGNQATIITYGFGVHWAMATLDANPDIKADLIDLRTLLPLDWDTIYTSVKKTGKVIVLHEDTLTGGIGAEIAARIAENCFEHLDAPVMRCAALDTAVPFAAELEWNFLPKNRFEGDLKKLVGY